MKNKFLNIMVSLIVIATLSVGSSGSASAMPATPTDETKVPHYFGPYPNWANSPFTLPDVQVIITGDGTGATAEAAVGVNGVIIASPSPIQGMTIRMRRSISCHSRLPGRGQAQRPM